MIHSESDVVPRDLILPPTNHEARITNPDTKPQAPYPIPTNFVANLALEMLSNPKRIFRNRLWQDVIGSLESQTGGESMKRRMSARVGMGFVILTASLIANLTGCQSNQKNEQPPLVAPDATVTMSHYAGSALSGAQARAVPERALDGVWSVQARVIAVEQMPSEGFDRLASQARLIVATRAGTPVAPSARFSPGLLARSVDADFDLSTLLPDANRIAEIKTVDGGVAVGATFELRIQAPAPPPAITEPYRVALTISVSRTQEGNAYELAIASQDLTPTPIGPAPVVVEDSFYDPPPPPMRIDRTIETLLVDRTIADPPSRDRLLVTIPMRFADSNVSGVLVDLMLDTDPQDAQRSGAIEAIKQGAIEGADTAGKQTPVTRGSSEELAMTSALAALKQTGDAPRGALAYLSSASGAKLTEAVVLVADDSLIQVIARTAAEQSSGLQKSDRANVAWLMERTTIAAIGAQAANAESPLSPGVYAALTTYAGEPGRQIDSLRALIAQSNGAEDLNNRLIAENLIYLEDASPASRVRAYDWLKSRGLAPESYDPLASARQRRAALEASSKDPTDINPANPRNIQPSNRP